MGVTDSERDSPSDSSQVTTISSPGSAFSCYKKQILSPLLGPKGDRDPPTVGTAQAFWNHANTLIHQPQASSVQIDDSQTATDWKKKRVKAQREAAALKAKCLAKAAEELEAAALAAAERAERIADQLASKAVNSEVL